MGKKVLIGIIGTIFNACIFVNAGDFVERWADHPEWLWFDDFESGAALKTNYQDVSTSGFSVETTDAVSGSRALRQHYTNGMVDAGWIIRSSNEGFPTHLFMRYYHKFENGFSGFPPKMARMRYRNLSNWSAPLEVHCWINTNKIVADVKAMDSKQANDVGWLPIARTNFSFENPVNVGRWVCFEMEVQLNTPGKQDGLYRMWADDSLIVERLNVDLRGSQSYLINEVMLDCYWNSGSPKEQNRYYDNFVISTQKIGPIGNGSVRINPVGKMQNTKLKKTSLLKIDKSQSLHITQNKSSVEEKYLLNGETIRR
jgi:hypothetical protein